MLRWLFPPVCELCEDTEHTEHSLCSHCCETRVPRVPKPLCLYCGSPVYRRLDDPWECPECAQKPRSFDFARAGFYGDEEMMELIHRYKYGRETHFARSFAQLMAEQWTQHPILSTTHDWTLIPVPVTRQKLLHRRFNQSRLLAEEIRRIFPRFALAEPLLRRHTAIRSQTLLTARERVLHANLSFRLKDEYKPTGKKRLPSANIIIIDDVYTTGSTVRSCAKQLRKISGISQIAVITAARAE